MAALWAVLTRLEDPTHPNLTLLQKVKLYDGQDVQGFSRDQVREMRETAPREGMQGISPRYVQDRIARCIASDRATTSPLDVLEMLEEGLRHHSMISNEETRKRYIQLVASAREEYEEIIKREVQVSIAADRQSIDALCGKYVDNVKAWVTREKVVDTSGRESDPDERLMRAIEEKIDISESRKSDFRHELMNYIAAVHIEGQTFDYRENARLTRALELKMFEDRRDTIQLTSLVSTVVDPDTQEKIGVIRGRLMREFGYDEVSADEVLHHVAGLFARGDAKHGPSEAAARPATASVYRIERDRARFREIVRGKLRKDLRKYLSTSELMGRRGEQTVSIPVPQIELPRFRFGDNSKKGVGQGPGEKGDPVDGNQQEGEGVGAAGDQEGQHVLEVEVDLDELAEMLGAELELPNILPRGDRLLVVRRGRYTGVRRRPARTRCGTSAGPIAAR